MGPTNLDGFFAIFREKNTHNFVKNDAKFENKDCFMQNFLGLDMKKLLDPKAVTFILGFWVFFHKLSHHKSATLTLIFTSRTSFFPESYMNPMKSWNFKKFHDLGDWVIKTTFFKLRLTPCKAEQPLQGMKGGWGGLPIIKPCIMDDTQNGKQFF